MNFEADGIGIPRPHAASMLGVPNDVGHQLARHQHHIARWYAVPAEFQQRVAYLSRCGQSALELIIDVRAVVTFSRSHADRYPGPAVSNRQSRRSILLEHPGDFQNPLDRPAHPVDQQTTACL